MYIPVDERERNKSPTKEQKRDIKGSTRETREENTQH